VGTCKWSFC